MPEVPTLASKLLEVAQAISHIEKGGRNDHHRYDYVQAVDVVARVRALLYERGVIVVPGAGNARHEAVIGGKGMLTTVDLSYTFQDAVTGEKVTIPWVGAGSDVGGDKGLYKAYTGGLKYALLSAFLIPTGDDPEGDQTTEAAGQGYNSKAADAERPAATRIPLDRAKAIMEAATEVGLASKGDDGAYVPTATLKAKLQLVANTDKVGLLNVDQAEELEAFIRAEKAS